MLKYPLSYSCSLKTAVLALHRQWTSEQYTAAVTVSSRPSPPRLSAWPQEGPADLVWACRLSISLSLPASLEEGDRQEEGLEWGRNKDISQPRLLNTRNGSPTKKEERLKVHELVWKKEEKTPYQSRAPLVSYPDPNGSEWNLGTKLGLSTAKHKQRPSLPFRSVPKSHPPPPSNFEPYRIKVFVQDHKAEI